MFYIFFCLGEFEYHRGKAPPPKKKKPSVCSWYLLHSGIVIHKRGVEATR